MPAAISPIATVAGPAECHPGISTEIPCTFREEPMRSPLPHHAKTWMPSELQVSILDYIKRRHEFGLGTTRSQVAAQFGLPNKATASYHLRQLHKLKLLNWKPKSKPTFEIPDSIRVLSKVG